jgi:hypothetical protein
MTRNRSAGKVTANGLEGQDSSRYKGELFYFPQYVQAVSNTHINSCLAGRMLIFSQDLSDRCVKLTDHLHVVLRLRMHGAFTERSTGIHSSLKELGSR